MGYETPTPIQTQSIPELLKGRDMLAAAQTGTGKTAAFALPILAQMLARPEKRTPKAVRALVLAPTRELATQIDENIRAYAARTDLKTALVFGGVNIKPQTAALAKGVDFLVATPGRLLDHLGQKNVTLENVGFLVLDEADRMLDMGFIHDIRKILKFLPVKRQTLLFSATFSDEIKALADTFLTDPLTVEIARNKESTLIHQEALAIAKKRKRELLRDLIVDNAWDQVLVFTRMKHTANRLAQQLEKDGITAAAIHGNKSQSARTKALAGFKNHSIRVLVATDIAARGLDIEGLPHVVNFELPEVAEDYVHRIGRTGRAGMEGHAVSLVAPEERDLLRAIEKLLKRRIDLTKAEGYDGEVPEDIARDNAERDKARAEELARLRESRRRTRERNGEAPRKKARASEALLKKASHAETTENPEERFVKKVVRKAQAVKENRGQEAQATRNARAGTADANRRGPRNDRRDRTERDDDNFGNRKDRQPGCRGSSARRESDPFEPRRQTLSLPQRMPKEDVRSTGRVTRKNDNRYGEGNVRGRNGRKPEGANGKSRYRKPDIVSTVMREDDDRRRRGNASSARRNDSRYESVSSNLPPGMVLKFRRR